MNYLQQNNSKFHNNLFNYQQSRIYRSLSHNHKHHHKYQKIHTKAKNPYMNLPKIMSNCKDTNEFRPQRALVVGKFTRYEFEKHRNPDLDEKSFVEAVSFNHQKISFFI